MLNALLNLIQDAHFTNIKLISPNFLSIKHIKLTFCVCWFYLYNLMTMRIIFGRITFYLNLWY